MDTRQESLRKLLEMWAQENGLELGQVQVSFQIKAFSLGVLDISPAEARAFRFQSHLLDEPLEDSDWEAILSFPWKPWQRSILEAAHLNPDRIVDKANTDFVKESRKGKNREYVYSAIQSINLCLRSTRMPYRFSNKAAGGSWRDGPFKLTKVFYRVKRKKIKSP